MKNKLEITVKQPSAESDEEDFDLFTVWKEYEAIAMHFNDLLLKIRTQSLAAVAAFATIAGVLLKGESISHELRWGILTAVFIALSVFWLAIWIIDFTYYNRLLLGAVRALIKIEEESKTSTRTSGIYVSTYIEEAVALRAPAKGEPFRLSKGRWTFYMLVFLLLLGLLTASVSQVNAPEKTAPLQAAPLDSAKTASSTPR